MVLSQPALSSRFASTGDVCPTVSISVPHSGGNLSSITGSKIPEDIVPIHSIADANGLVHLMVKLPLKKDSSGRRKTLACMCKLCKEKNIRHDVTYYCHTCGLSANYCSPDDRQHHRDCFLLHVNAIKRNRSWRGEVASGE
jgi:hypothetical protein